MTQLANGEFLREPMWPESAGEPLRAHLGNFSVMGGASATRPAGVPEKYVHVVVDGRDYGWMSGAEAESYEPYCNQPPKAKPGEEIRD